MAFGSFGSEEDEPLADINVTPLVDVMLVLLIVFMITMPVLTHSIPLQLPTGNTKSDVQPKEPLRLAINKEGQYALGTDSTFISEEALKTSLVLAHKTDENTVLAIAADKAVPYDFVAKALAAAKEAGLSKVGFVTEEAK